MHLVRRHAANGQSHALLPSPKDALAPRDSEDASSARSARGSKSGAQYAQEELAWEVAL